MNPCKDLESLSEKIIAAAIEVHRELGPGLLESAYERCLIHELSLRGIPAERQRPQPLCYKGLELDECYRIDVLVDGQIIIEIKAVESLLPVHKAQIISYLKLSNKRLGFLMNFHEATLKAGLKRFINTK